MAYNQHENPVWNIVSRVLMLLAAFLLFLSYASMLVNPARAWFMTVIGLLFVPIAVLNVLLFLWAVHRRSRSFWIPLLALLPSAILLGRYLQFSSGAEEKKPGAVKVMTYNVGKFGLGQGDRFKGESGVEACIDSVARYLRAVDADIVCLQEVNMPGEYDAAQFFRKHFPGYNAGYFMYVSDEGTYGNVILSRFPIRDKGKMVFERSANMAVWTDLDVHGGTVRVYNCHFESYSISLGHLAKSIGRDSTIVRSTGEKMKKSISRRPEQVEMVLADIEDCPVKAIVTGDFNDNPLSYTYHRLMKGRKDTFVEAGKGFGATYSALWPFIRIDYILYPKEFGAVSNRIPRLDYSDHYPVVAEINIPRDE